MNQQPEDIGGYDYDDEGYVVNSRPEEETGILCRLGGLQNCV